MGKNTLKFEIAFVPDFTPEVTPKMIAAGMDVLRPKVEQNLKRVVANPAYLFQDSRSTGSLFKSISTSNTFFRDGRTRFFANIYFEGTDEKRLDPKENLIERKSPIRQGEKAAYLNYGATRTKRGTTHRTLFKNKADTAAKRGVETAMQKVLNEALNNI